MRLRYFHIREYPPLQNVEIVFSADSPLKTQNAIHFVVGVNGSGKTHLLQALTETFLQIEKRQVPASCPFPVTLVYELKQLGNENTPHTFIFDNPANGKGEIAWWQSPVGFHFPKDAVAKDFQHLVGKLRSARKSEWNNLITNSVWSVGEGNIGLPKALLAYTTGITTPWENLFIQRVQAGDITSETDAENPPEERPVYWTEQSEQAYQDSLIIDGNQPGDDSNTKPIVENATNFDETLEICQFITPFMLKLAVLAVTLPQALKDFQEYDTDAKKQLFIKQVRNKKCAKGLPDLLSHVGWVWPVSLIFEFDFTAKKFDYYGNRQGHFWADALLKLAVAVIREPEPSTKRRAIIDLGKVEAHELKDLIDVSVSPFSVFQRLIVLHRMGLLDNLQIGVRKTDPDDILLFDELSDGEQMYLGRMALFHLLQGQDDALLLLDEPETHFNDRWKRDMVDIIDQVLGEQANHVLISTHSGITLTDVFTDEITVIEKDKFGHAKQKHLEGIHTFGATPDHPLRDVFGAPDTVGKRAAALLDVLLLCEPNKRIVEELFYLQADSREYDRLSKIFVKAVQAEFKDKHDAKRIRSIIETLCNIANDERYVKQPTVAALMKYFADSVGPGYYQFDLYRSVYRLTKGDMDAA